MKTITKTYTLYDFNELKPDIQESVLDNYRYINVEDCFDWWEDDGLAEYKTEIFRFKKIYFDLDRAHYIQFPDLYVNNEVAFYKWLGILESLQERITYSFDDSGNKSNTYLMFDYTQSELTKSEIDIIENAITQFADWMEEALKRLQQNYDYLTSDEAIKETIEANDYKFLEDGTSANHLDN